MFKVKNLCNKLVKKTIILHDLLREWFFSKLSVSNFSERGLNMRE